MSDASQSLSDVLDSLTTDRDDDGAVTIGEVRDALGQRAFAPLIFVIGLITVSPLGGLPGAPVIFGAMLVLIAAQYLVSGGALWLPGFIEKRGVAQDRMEEAVGKVRPWAERLETVIKARATFLSEPPWSKAVGAAVLVLGVLFVPLGLVPFGVALPAAAVAALGLGMMNNDGVVIGIGLAVFVAAIILAGVMLL